MAYCTKCGQEIDDDAAYCPNCGTSMGSGGYTQQPYHPSQNNAYNAPRNQYNPNMYNYDSGSIGWAILGFFIPIVGLILFLVWIGDKPRSAKMAGLGALINVILSVLLFVLPVVILGLMGGSSSTSTILSLLI